MRKISLTWLLLLVILVARPVHAKERISNLDVYKRLQNIQLPDKPNEQQVRQYVEAIINEVVAINKEHWLVYSSGSAIVDHLAAVPAESFSILRHYEYKYRGVQGPKAFLNFAYTTRAKKFKSQIIAALPSDQYLITIIEDNGWLEDAKPQIMTVVKTNPQAAQFFVRAAFRLKPTPELLDMWIRHLQAGGDKAEILRLLDDNYAADQKQLRPVVQALFVKQAPGRHVAKFGLRFGSFESLDAYMKWLADIVTRVAEVRPKSGDAKKIYAKLRNDVIDRFDYEGTDQDFVAWFVKNRAQMKFSDETRKYYLPGR